MPAVQCSAVQVSLVICKAQQCYAVQSSVVVYRVLRCSAVQCSAVQCNAKQSSALHHYFHWYFQFITTHYKLALELGPYRATIYILNLASRYDPLSKLCLSIFTLLTLNKNTCFYCIDLVLTFDQTKVSIQTVSRPKPKCDMGLTIYCMVFMEFSVLSSYLQCLRQEEEDFYYYI